MQTLLSKLIEAQKVLTLIGPTASGKSGLSLLLAKKLPIEIISVDSALIYQGMNIGTAKPTMEEQARVPHHLIDIISPDQTYSASEFVDDVNRLVPEILNRGHLPVLVGGTMMYLNALQQGIAELPEADPQIRQKWLSLWHSDAKTVHQRLQAVDPIAANRIHENDSQRLVRALEVFDLTGEPLSTHQSMAKEKSMQAFSLVKIGLIPENRAKLHQQIEKRFDVMLDQGFLDEIQQLKKAPLLHPDLPSIRSVGYRQAWQYLDGDYDFETFRAKSIVATRQLAKRQLTWLRKETELTVIDPFVHQPLAQLDLTLSRLQKSVMGDGLTK